MSRIPASAFAVIALAAALAGCTSTAAEPAAGPTDATAVATPATPAPTSPAATPTPAPTTPPALETLVLSPDGLGDLMIGSPVPPETPSSLVVSDADHCAAEFAAAGMTDRSDVARWLPNYPDGDIGVLGSAPFGVGVDDESGLVQAIQVSTSTITTAGGVHVGSPEADVVAMDATLTSEGPVRLYSVTGDAGILFYEVAHDAMFAAQNGTVLTMYVRTPEHANDAPTWGRDDSMQIFCGVA